jgi:Glycosyl hydrolases family 2, TIM barrel domain
MKNVKSIIITIIIFSSICSIQAQDLINKKWTSQEAWNWYEKLSPFKGFNYLPSTAVNSTEMWQAQTFDPKTIDRELGWAEEAGYNSARVFLQYLVWKEDPKAYKERLEKFLQISNKHGISVMFIFFDDCAFAGKEPYLGKQDDPVPGVHNSGWTPSPGKERVVNKKYWAELEDYVKDVVGSFKNDKRVVVWDMYNEPGNSEMWEKSFPLVEASFRWAREVAPSQPLTVAPFGDFYNIFSKKSLMTKRLFELSDVISFHAYETPDGIEEKLNVLLNNYDRPLICTEWLRRQNGGTFSNVLPMFAENKVSWYQWGLVAGKTQTFMHWGSKKGDPEPVIWQHDVFDKDGRAYNLTELELVKNFQFTD